MEHYGLRQAGTDIDFVVCAADYDDLADLYPHGTQDLFGDLGVRVNNFEFWKCIILFGYEFLAKGAIEYDSVKVIALEKLLFLKSLAIAEPKYERDVRLIVRKIHDIQYGKDDTYDCGFVMR